MMIACKIPMVSRRIAQGTFWQLPYPRWRSPRIPSALGSLLARSVHPNTLQGPVPFLACSDLHDACAASSSSSPSSSNRRAGRRRAYRRRRGGGALREVSPWTERPRSCRRWPFRRRSSTPARTRRSTSARTHRRAPAPCRRTRSLRRSFDMLDDRHSATSGGCPAQS